MHHLFILKIKQGRIPVVIITNVILTTYLLLNKYYENMMNISPSDTSFDKIYTGNHSEINFNLGKIF